MKRFVLGVAVLSSLAFAVPVARDASAFENDFIVTPKPTPAAPIRRKTINTRGFPAGPGAAPAARPAASSGFPAPPPVQGQRATTPGAPTSGFGAPPPLTAAPPSTAGARRAAAPAASSSKEQAVDLNAMDSAPAADPRALRSLAPQPAPGPSLGANLKFFFDFMYRSRLPNHPDSNPGFDSFHQLIMAEYAPTPEFQFTTELGSAVFGMGTIPKFFEFDYQVTPKLQLRWGKIWIPFDDMNPHNIFGGRINAATFLANPNLIILPTIWADLGAGFRYRLVEKSPYTFDLYGYVVNGFQQINADPVTGTTTPYPNFQTLGNPGGSTGDNNAAKDFGLRGQLKAGQRWAAGLSFYKGTYTSKGATAILTPATAAVPITPLGLSMVGVDAQYKVSNVTDVRVGYILTSIDLAKAKDVTGADLPSSAKRAGDYIELSQKFGDRSWRALIRAGQIQADDRAETVGDSRVIGGALQKSFGPLTIGFEISHDHEKSRRYGDDARKIRLRFRRPPPRNGALV